MMTIAAMFRTFCTVWKPFAISSCATTSDTPSICSSICLVCVMRLLSSSVTTNRSRRVSASMPAKSSASFCVRRIHRAPAGGRDELRLMNI